MNLMIIRLSARIRCRVWLNGLRHGAAQATPGLRASAKSTRDMDVLRAFRGLWMGSMRRSPALQLQPRDSLEMSGVLSDKG